MKMRSISRFFMGMLAVCTIAACSDDLGNGSDVNPDASKDAVYMNVTVQLPVAGGGARSQTKPEGGSTDGIEIGQNYENDVKSVLLILAKTDNSFIACAEKSTGTPTKEADGTITATQSISKSVLSAYYGENGTLTTEEKNIHVFVFCNPTDALKRIFTGIQRNDNTWYDQICSISETPAPNASCDNAGIWGGSDHQAGFLMSSYKIAEKQLPTHFSSWDKYISADSPFMLSEKNSNMANEDGGEIDNTGSIEVERSVARFDFKDGSPKGNNTYDVIFDKAETPNCLVQIQLTKMALVNMSKNFYYLRRVSNNGLKDSKEGNDYALCDVEYANNNKANYVVDTDATEKENKSIISGNKYANHFNFCLGHTYTENGQTKWTIDKNAREQWYSSTINAVLNGDKDNDETWNNGTPNKGDYKIWRYVTENTIPAPPAIQKHGISTGIVFKGKMVATEHDQNSSLYKALTSTDPVSANNPILYAYGSDIFVRWTEVRAMAIEAGENSPMYKAIFGTLKDGVVPVAEKAAEGENPKVDAVYSNDENSADYKWDAWYNKNRVNNDKLKEFKVAATTAGFTLYERSSDGEDKGYYCYYYYWNRHNDNSKPAVMGIMEFAVVRNNVYKLAVTNISKLGHPRISENDPDPENPDNPDEDGDVYLSVSVKILPWVVRINNIEF